MNFAKYLAIASAVLLTACSTSDTIDDGSVEPSADNTSGTSSSDLTSFSVAIDRQTAEPETSVEEEFFSTEDVLDMDDDPFTTIVNIAFNGSEAVVDEVEGITITSDGAHVTADHGQTKNVSYRLSGSTSDGSLTVAGEKKFEVVLGGVDITNPDSAALNLLCGKRAFIVLQDGTQNVLRDGTSSLNSHKGALYCKGKILFNGSGMLDVYGNYNNAIHSADYIVFRAGNNIYAKSTANNGIKANDGIIINGGIINVETSATAGKGINCEYEIAINGGRTTIITTGGGEYDSDEGDTNAAAALKADSTLYMRGGELFVKSTGKGGKGIKTDWECYISGGVVHALTEGSVYSYGSLTSSPKAIKVGTKGEHGVLEVSGGTIMARTSGSKGEGLESKGTLTVSDGTVKIYAYDDGINSAGDMYIKGGTIVSVGRNSDGIDANGNLYISGGNLVGVGAGGAESGIDVGENKRLYVTGGSFIGIGGRIDASLGSTTQGIASYSGSITANATAKITNSGGSTTYATFLMPPVSTSGTVMASCPSMTSGTSYRVYMGTSYTSVTAYSTLSSGGMGGGGKKW